MTSVVTANTIFAHVVDIFKKQKILNEILDKNIHWSYIQNGLCAYSKYIIQHQVLYSILVQHFQSSLYNYYFHLFKTSLKKNIL